MAVGTDRVQVYKQERSDLGGDDADAGPYGSATPQPINPQEDALESAGVYLQDASNRDESVYLERSGDDLRLVDVANAGGLSLSQLRGLQLQSVEETTQFDPDSATYVQVGSLSITPPAGDWLVVTILGIENDTGLLGAERDVDVVIRKGGVNIAGSERSSTVGNNVFASIVNAILANGLTGSDTIDVAIRSDPGNGVVVNNRGLYLLRVKN